MPYGDPRYRNNSPRFSVPARSVTVIDTNSELIKETAEIVFREAAIWQAIEPVLKVWIEKRGYFTAQMHTGEYIAQRSDIGHIGEYPLEPYIWPTYHEMLADLLARIDAQGGAI